MNKNILLVEDDTFLQGLAAGKMTKEGLNVLTAKNDQEALKIIDENEINCILLDLLLPGVSGYEILQKIRENPKTAKIPVIVFSNLSEPSDIKKASEFGATEFMIKSNFTLEELTEKVKSFLN